MESQKRRVNKKRERGREEEEKEAKKGMETRDLNRDVWISMILVWITMDISWFHLLGFS